MGEILLQRFGYEILVVFPLIWQIYRNKSQVAYLV